MLRARKCFEMLGQKYHVFPTEVPEEGQICLCGETKVVEGKITKINKELCQKKNSQCTESFQVVS